MEKIKEWLMDNSGDGYGSGSGSGSGAVSYTHLTLPTT